MMRFEGRMTLVVGVMGTLLLAAGLALAGVTAPLELLTKEEALLAPPPHGLVQVGRFLNDGPEIKVAEPQENIPCKPPLTILIRFIPNSGKDVDLSKLKIEVLKIINIDITKKILPFATKEGIKVENASLPQGEHKIRVIIGDVGGGMTEKVLLVKVL